MLKNYNYATCDSLCGNCGERLYYQNKDEYIFANGNVYCCNLPSEPAMEALTAAKVEREKLLAENKVLRVKISLLEKELTTTRSRLVMSGQFRLDGKLDIFTGK